MNGNTLTLALSFLFFYNQILGNELKFGDTENNKYSFTKSLDFSAEDPCDEQIQAGQIGTDQIVCDSDELPNPIISLVSPQGNNLTFEFLWIYTTENPLTGMVVWYSIPGAVSADYAPSFLNQTTWYRRCTRPAGCQSYTGESNIVKIEVQACVSLCDDLVIELISSLSPNCNTSGDGAIDIEISGGLAPYTFNWNNGLGNVEDPQQLFAGEYVLDAIDANGCEISFSTVLEAPTSLKGEAIITNSSCYGANDGALLIDVSGGNPPYNFYWESSYSNENHLTGLSAGIYTVTIIDANGCSTYLDAQIQEPEPVVLFAEVVHETCAGNDGSISLEISGGVEPYFLQWSNGVEGISNQFNLSEGIYAATVTDANGCSAAQSEIKVHHNCDPLIIDFGDESIAIANEESIHLDWTTWNEQDGGDFVVQRSRDNIHFDFIQNIIPAKGFSDIENQYTFPDLDPFPGTNYYKIMHLSKDGEITYSASASIFFQKPNTPSVLIYPNPVVNEVFVDFLKPQEKNTSLHLFNGNGQKLMSQKMSIGETRKGLILKDVPPGIYFLSVEVKGRKPFVKQIFKEENF